MSGNEPDFERLVRRFGARAFARGAAAWVKDGIHDMAVVLKHDGDHVVAIRGWTHGYPWSTCPGANAQLDAFVGARIDGPARPRSVDQQSQCTHLLDLARLAMAHAARGGKFRYWMTIVRTQSAPNEMLDARAERDGQLLLRWSLTDYVVAAPSEMAGHKVDGRAVLPEAITADGELFEAAMMLRRAVKMFRGRDRAHKMPMDIAPADRSWMMGACYTFQPEVAPRAIRAGPFGSG